MSDPHYELMHDIEARYQIASGLTSRGEYSVFYGPLRPSKLLMINANPGGSPTDYKIVNVYAGQHEYVEGKASGPTTRNGAEILTYILGLPRTGDLKSVQVLNRFFRRSPRRPTQAVERSWMQEARPFLAELITFIKPEVLIFGGDTGVPLFAEAHGATLKSGNPILGPNGSSSATYLCEHEITLPYYKRIPALGIYPPSKLNGFFRTNILPILRERVRPHLGA